MILQCHFVSIEFTCWPDVKEKTDLVLLMKKISRGHMQGSMVSQTDGSLHMQKTVSFHR